MDMHNFYMGNVFEAYNFYGAHVDAGGTVFRTYAPNAYRVCIIGEFNNWQEAEMQHSGQNFIYYSADARDGQMYKYVIYSAAGRTEHCDPYGFAMELRPAFASIITDLYKFRFSDEEWMKKRSLCLDRPVNIYEVHFGSWRKGAQGWYTYNGLAGELIDYVKKNGYTHIEFMPLAEHPADESWGYQITGFFAPTARYGKPWQLMELVDMCHRAGIGVIMDFVPVHFASDHYALARYDGAPLYEYPDSAVGVSEWGSSNFIHSRREVCSFLQSAANYWLDVYHFDGLRMDAISRAIYWAGDPARGVNGATVDFLKRMNDGLHQRHPSAMLIAEDSTNYPQVTAPVQYGGLGFDYKWDLGWMNDTLDYMKKPPEERAKNPEKITFSMHYFKNEHYLLPLCHDENVHGKATVAQKMYGGYEEKFPQARLLYMYMYTHPGKKLLFMGSEFAQLREWDEKREQDWELLDFPVHKAFSDYMRDLCTLCARRKSLYAADYDSASFEWIDPDRDDRCVFVYRRKVPGESTVVMLNFSDKEQKVKAPGELKELLCTDESRYGGTQKRKASSKTVILAPYSGKILDENADKNIK